MAKDLEITGKDHTIKNEHNVVVGGYVLDTVDGVTTKTRFAEVKTEGAGHTGGRVVDELSETWGEGFQNYRKEWHGPNGECTVLEAVETVDNGDGTFNVRVKRTDARFDDKFFTLVMRAEDGAEIDRFDDDGNKYDACGAPADAAADLQLQAADGNDEMQTVTVDAWGTGNKNDCLSRIIMNAYGVKANSTEYKEIEKLVMDANPEIYGDENGNGGRNRLFDGSRHNAVIHAGDKIKLPVWNGNPAIVDNTAPDNGSGDGNTPTAGGGNPSGGAEPPAGGGDGTGDGTAPVGGGDGAGDPPVTDPKPPVTDPEPPVTEPEQPVLTPPLKKVGTYWQKIEASDGKTITYLYYDEAGTKVRTRTEIFDDSSDKLEYSYDEAGRLTSSTVTNTADGTSEKCVYKYNGNTRYTSEKLSYGKNGKVTWKLEYDTDGTSEKYVYGYNGNTRYTVRKESYDKNGNLTGKLETKKINDYTSQVWDEIQNSNTANTLYKVMNDESLTLDDFGSILNGLNKLGNVELKLGLYRGINAKSLLRIEFTRMAGRSSEKELSDFMAKHSVAFKYYTSYN